jgi:hypothetical protein
LEGGGQVGLLGPGVVVVGVAVVGTRSWAGARGGVDALVGLFLLLLR